MGLALIKSSCCLNTGRSVVVLLNIKFSLHLRFDTPRPGRKERRVKWWSRSCTLSNRQVAAWNQRSENLFCPACDYEARRRIPGTLALNKVLQLPSHPRRDLGTDGCPSLSSRPVKIWHWHRQRLNLIQHPGITVGSRPCQSLAIRWGGEVLRKRGGKFAFC